MMKILIILLWCIALPVFASPSTAENSPGVFMSVSDIHFNPFADCSAKEKECRLIMRLRKAPAREWGRIFQKHSHTKPVSVYHDANYALLKASFKELKRVKEQEKPAFVFLLGDFLAHDFKQKYRRYSGDRTFLNYEPFVKKTLEYLTLEFKTVFSDIDVYPVIGNNDTYTRNYRSVPNGRFLKDMTIVWSSLIVSPQNKKRFQNQFPLAGFYEVTLPNYPHHKILFLNTVLFSPHDTTQAGTRGAIKQLAWFKKQLTNTKADRQTLWLAYHIPMGVDIYSTIKAKFSTVRMFWQDRYSEQFQNDLEAFPNRVTAIFAGHLHRDLFQFITLKDMGEIPVYITPSISPVYGNSPSFKVFYFDKNNLTILNSTVYSYSAAQSGEKWHREYSAKNKKLLMEPTC